MAGVAVGCRESCGVRLLRDSELTRSELLPSWPATTPLTQLLDKQLLEQDEGDRTHPSRPMRQPDRSKGVNHLQGNYIAIAITYSLAVQCSALEVVTI